MKIGIITMQRYDNRKKGTVGSSRIRGNWLIKHSDMEHYHMGKKYDCLVFQKAYWKKMARDFKGIKVFDICDPDWLEPRPVIEMISHCDGVTTSTKALKEQLEKFDVDKPILHIPDRVDLEWSQPRKQKHESRAKLAVWFGYHTSAGVLDKVITPLNKRDVRLKVISNRSYRDADEFVEYETETVNEEIIKADFVIQPEYSSTHYRNKFKSNNKIVQSWALRMPVVQNGEQLDRFLDPQEREKEADKRFKEVKEKWDVKLSVKQLKNFIERINEKIR